MQVKFNFFCRMFINTDAGGREEENGIVKLLKISYNVLRN